MGFEGKIADMSGAAESLFDLRLEFGIGGLRLDSDWLICLAICIADGLPAFFVGDGPKTVPLRVPSLLVTFTIFSEITSISLSLIGSDDFESPGWLSYSNGFD